MPRKEITIKIPVPNCPMKCCDGKQTTGMDILCFDYVS